MLSVVAALLVIFAAAPAEKTAADTSFDTVVVCPAAFHEAMKPWLELRAGQGRRVKLISNRGSAEEIRDEIRKTAGGGRLRFVLLVGGADPRMNNDAGVRARSVPMHYAAARINVKWGSTPTIPTDNWYVQAAGADDASPLPAIAIGRLPATSPEELAVMVKKIVDYERGGLQFLATAVEHRRRGGQLRLRGRYAPGSDGDVDPDGERSGRVPRLDDLCQLAQPVLP